MNRLNEASLNYYDQLKKMQALNSGTRGFNVGAASREKIRYNYTICVQDGLTRAKTFIEDELKKIYGNLDMIADLIPQKLPKLSHKNNDFHYADYAFVKNNPIKELVGKDIYYTFIYLIFAMLLRDSAKVDVLKAELEKVYNISTSEIKKALDEILADQKNKEDLYNIANFKESNESLDEGTEKVKDGKWVNKGKEGTHGTFKTKKAADAQRKAMFANGFSEEYINKLVEILKDPKYADIKEQLNSYKENLTEEATEDIYYHGSLTKFDKFADDRTNWFSDSYDYANSYGNWAATNNYYIYKVNLKFKKVFDIGKTGYCLFLGVNWSAGVKIILNDKGLTDEDINMLVKAAIDEGWVTEADKYRIKISTLVRTDAFRQLMLSKGYNCVKTIEYCKELDKNVDCYGMFDSTDINIVDIEEKTNEANEVLDEKVEKHDTLNPLLFDTNNKLLPEVREKLLAIAKEFTDGLEEDEIKFNLKDIKIVGSNCSYNYNENSDLDLHLVAETTSLHCPDDLYPLLYSAYRSIFNSKFDPVIHGIPVELFVETEETEQINNAPVNEARQQSALNSAGIYSVLNDEWIKEPEQADIPEINQTELDKLVQPWIDRYNEIKLNPTVEAIEKYIEDIYETRKAGIARSEYDLDNLTFKEIRGLGYLDELKDLRNELRSKELSLESLQEVLNEVSRRDYQKQITQAVRDQVILDNYGNFTINLVKESDVDNLIRRLRQLDFVEDLSKIAGKFDFSRPVFTGIQPRYWTIRGKIKEN